MITADDFVFTTGNTFHYLGKMLSFTSEDIDEYYQLGMTMDHIHTYAYMYLVNDDFTSFANPRYAVKPN